MRGKTRGLDRVLIGELEENRINGYCPDCGIPISHGGECEGSRVPHCYCSDEYDIKIRYDQRVALFNEGKLNKEGYSIPECTFDEALKEYSILADLYFQLIQKDKEKGDKIEELKFTFKRELR